MWHSAHRKHFTVYFLRCLSLDQSCASTICNKCSVVFPMQIFISYIICSSLMVGLRTCLKTKKDNWNTHTNVEFFFWHSLHNEEPYNNHYLNVLGKRKWCFDCDLHWYINLIWIVCFLSFQVSCICWSIRTISMNPVSRNNNVSMKLLLSSHHEWNFNVGLKKIGLEFSFCFWLGN